MKARFQAASRAVDLHRWVQSPAWLKAFLAAAALTMAVGLIQLWTSEFRSGNNWGVAYGITAAVLLASVSAYSIRRRSPGRGPASARHWLQFHIFGGGLFLLMVLMHTAFRLPHGVLAWSLWILSLWLAVSGILGTLIQRWIPRLLTSGLATEANYDRLPDLAKAVREEAESLAEAGSIAVRRYFQDNLQEGFAQLRTRPIFFVDITGGAQAQLRQSSHIRGFLEADEQKTLDRLIELFQAKTELDAHHTLQKALRWWLYGHVPFALVLILLVVVHVLTVLYY